MRKSIFFVMLIFVLFLTSCSAVDDLKSDTQNDVYIKAQNEQGNNIDFQIVDEENLNIPEQNNAQIKSTKDSGFKIMSIFCDRNKNIIPVSIATEKTLSVIKTGLRVTIFSPGVQKELRDYGLYCILPDDININSISLDKNTVKIDFNEGFYKKENLKFYLTAITFYLTSFYNIDEVYYFVDGKPYSQKPFIKKNKNESIIFVPQKVESNLFIIPKWINIKYNKKDEYVIKSFNELIQSLSYRFSVLNGLKLNNIKLNDSTMYIDLTEQILKLKGSAQVDSILKSICFTAKEIDRNIRYIKLSVNGKFLYIDQYDLNNPIGVDQFELNPINIKL